MRYNLDYPAKVKQLIRHLGVVVGSQTKSGGVLFFFLLTD